MKEIKIIIRSDQATEKQLNDLANTLQEIAQQQLTTDFKFSITVE